MLVGDNATPCFDQVWLFEIETRSGVVDLNRFHVGLLASEDDSRRFGLRSVHTRSHTRDARVLSTAGVADQEIVKGE